MPQSRLDIKKDVNDATTVRQISVILRATKFSSLSVWYVESPFLAAMLPVLSRGLNDKVEVATRTCCLFVYNMPTFLEDPAAVILDAQVEAVTRTCCLIFDKKSKFVEDPTAVIPAFAGMKAA